MKDVMKYIEAEGVKYPMAFNINVVEVMQEKFGTIQKWSNALEAKEPRMKDIKFTFTECINEGIDIENEKNGENRPFVTEKQVGRILGALTDDANGVIRDLVIESNDNGKEKN
ncbi:hypothetical protein [Anaerosacchariphilus polymeriproducens]|uniref:Phage protein n=1 Tax=Anaerosacchariphilus polymeriproducens TaxID=1812858 RepID=A0A371AT63_9FIRM|nr:hypothetical protein [Anaerosacchariphilus polymeriproducens]RDU22758.1 hypothetical protein DWV06_13395 [Anaerosacchariphilus polymeriproducens]